MHVQINEAWKVKATVDPTLLPKGKSQAKHASVTLPENQEEELPEIEQTLRNPDTVTMMDFEQTSYFEMRLDNADIYDKPNAGEERAPDLHQVDAENITLLEHFESRHTDMFNHFERFDIEGDDDTQMNFTQPEDAQIPSTPVPFAPKEQAHKPDGIPDRHPEEQPFEHFQGGIGSPYKGISIEKQRANLNNYEIPPEILMENLRANLTNMGLRPTEADGVKETGHMATPGSEILMETGPTQTQRPFVTQPLDMVTDTIRKQLKSHFNTPGSAETACLNELTLGLTKKQAACLFYQTCVLATRDFIKVQQEVPYGNILISRGAKM
ncbi:sister chromatid cohesion 1 protein 1 [Capsicum galapagoense]